MGLTSPQKSENSHVVPTTSITIDRSEGQLDEKLAPTVLNVCIVAYDDQTLKLRDERMVRKMWGQPLAALLCCVLAVSCGTSEKVPRSTGGNSHRDLVEAGKFAECAKALEPLAWERRADEDGPELMLLLARCEEGLGRPGDAERTLYRCLAATKCTAENKVSVYEGLSRLARAAGRHFSANRHLKKALEVGPHSRSQDSIRFLMIRASIDQGELMDARSILKEVVHREDPEFALLSKQLGGSSASNRVIRPAPLAPKEPRIMSRKQWRARPVNFRGNPTRLGRPYRITIHHGAEKVAAPTSLSGAASRVRSYQSSHQVGNGWADIGYHFVIDAAGRIWEGRELKWQGAHAGSPAANKGNIGVCLMGDFEKVAPNYAQKKGLERLLDHLTTRYGISWRSVEGHNSVLQRHHRGRGTQCPGRHLQGWLDRLKRQHAS